MSKDEQRREAERLARIEQLKAQKQEALQKANALSDSIRSLQKLNRRGM